MYSGTRAGGARRLIFVNPKQGPIWNKYIVGSGVGAVTRANRAAYKKRANINAQQKPCGPRCCNYPCRGCELGLFVQKTQLGPDQRWYPYSTDPARKYLACVDGGEFRTLLEWESKTHGFWNQLVEADSQLVQILSNPTATGSDLCREFAKALAYATAIRYQPTDQGQYEFMATSAYPTGSKSCGYTTFAFVARSPPTDGFTFDT